jgi:hypothetical protein
LGRDFDRLKNVGREAASDASNIWNWSGGAFNFDPDGKGMPYIHLGTTNWPRIDRCEIEPLQIVNRRPVYAEALK